MAGGVAAGLVAGALWGLVFVAPRMVTGFSSVDLTAGRFLSYGAVSVLMLLWAARGPRRVPTGSQALAAIGMSVLGFTGYYLLLVLAIRDAGTEVPTLIIGTIPIWVMLLGKPEHLLWRSLVPGLLLTAAGLGLMMASPHAGTTAAGSPNYWRGIVLVLLALACWTAFAILNAAWMKKHRDVNATEWANWLGVATGLGALVLWLVAGSPARELAAQPQLPLFATLAVATGFGSAWLATILWNVASRRLSASLCGQLIVSETLFALVYSFAWDGQWPTPAQWAACVLFTLGILASIRAHR
ncbi:DMT family transporter [Ramlibacter humi]|uniref:DMT family transporter n=1 Tax=Ramlibacter humi TaxID=2530451 RepID=A0A4Z0BIA1_9BURK|nr:DMT family transporter [Ramlibacter humi]TFY97628.1 DMT family transporter [Ramlibacter humi]